jgi:hypothetical protein
VSTDAAGGQLALPLEPGPPADTPPPCPSCQGRGWVLAIGLVGGITCEWCQGSGADPEAITPAAHHTRARNSRSDQAAGAGLERLAS